MANPAGDFTAGGQLFEAYWNMFLSSLRPILWISLGVALVTWIYLLYFVIQEKDWYYLGMWALAQFWDFINGDPNKLFNVHQDGFVTQVRGVNLAHYPPIADAMDRWFLVLKRTFGMFVISAGLTSMFYIPFAERIGKATRKRSKERGAFVTNFDSLREMIEEDNKPKMRNERAEVHARIEELKAAGYPTETEERALQYTPYTLAGIPFPWRLETTHALLMGTTGTGKSTALKKLLLEIRQRRQRAVIFDLTGSFVESFYDPERDIILNPLDERCPHWSIFHDATNKLHLRSAAEALIPHNGGNGEQFWTEAARMMLVEACWKLMQHGMGSNRALYDEIMTSVLPNLHALLEGTVAGPVSEPEAKRMAESVRATLNAHAHAIELLPTEGERFSIREWIREDTGKGGFLFISATTTHLSTLRSILTLWYDTAIYSLMEMDTAQRDLRMWFLFDEMAALHRLPSLENGMRTARNFGGAFVLGLHTIQQLWATYGREMGDTIASLGRTKLFLASPDVASAEWCSDNIGKTEWKEFKKTTTVGVDRIRDGIGYSEDTEYKAIALPEEIMNLPSLTGYIKMPEGYPAALVRMKFEHYPKIHKGFIERAIFSVQVGLDDEHQEDANDAASEVSGMEDRTDSPPSSASAAYPPQQLELPDTTMPANPMAVAQPAVPPAHSTREASEIDNSFVEFASGGAALWPSSNPNTTPVQTTPLATGPESRGVQIDPQKPEGEKADFKRPSKQGAAAPAKTLGAQIRKEKEASRKGKDVQTRTQQREAEIIRHERDDYEAGA